MQSLSALRSLMGLQISCLDKLALDTRPLLCKTLPACIPHFLLESSLLPLCSKPQNCCLPIGCAYLRLLLLFQGDLPKQA